MRLMGWIVQIPVPKTGAEEIPWFYIAASPSDKQCNVTKLSHISANTDRPGHRRQAGIDALKPTTSDPMTDTESPP